jgi:hypothetical protein
MILTSTYDWMEMEQEQDELPGNKVKRHVRFVGIAIQEVERVEASQLSELFYSEKEVEQFRVDAYMERMIKEARRETLARSTAKQMRRSSPIRQKSIPPPRSCFQERPHALAA